MIIVFKISNEKKRRKMEKTNLGKVNDYDKRVLDISSVLAHIFGNVARKAIKEKSNVNNLGKKSDNRKINKNWNKKQSITDPKNPNARKLKKRYNKAWKPTKTIENKDKNNFEQ